MSLNFLDHCKSNQYQQKNRSLEQKQDPKQVDSIVKFNSQIEIQPSKPEKSEGVLVAKIKESLKRQYKSVDNLFGVTKNLG